jgi:hypothetical protein
VKNTFEKMVALHESLAAADIRHAFGGALALAWCLEHARGTAAVAVNVFLPPEAADGVLSALPQGVTWSESDLVLIRRDGQVRLRWDITPVDLFFNTTEFHERVATRVRWEPFHGRDLPFLACRDLGVFKVFSNRGRDWGDLEEMRNAGTLDVEAVLGVIVHYLGADDERVERLRALGADPG